jgi:uncharacterized protein YqfA (UPF0365 family)
MERINGQTGSCTHSRTNLDQCGDEELNARTPSEKSKARAKMIEAEREYAAALDALHDGNAGPVIYYAVTKRQMSA